MEGSRLPVRLGTLLRDAGAVACGFAEAMPVEEGEWALFREWLAKGWHAGMGYMENYPEIRRDPRLLLDGARTVVSMAFNYRQPNPFPGVATYALGEDYHKVLRRRLKAVVRQVKEEFGGAWRICIDSAPILERYWARKAGVGYRSPLHGNIVVPGVGSMVFLAELITDLEIPAAGLASGETVAALPSIDICSRGELPCPTGALQPGGVVDSRRCINYLTIECRDELTEEERRLVGSAVFGCDICQRCCAENRETPCLPVLPEFDPLPGLGEYLRGEPSGFDISRSPLQRGKNAERMNFLEM